MIPIEFHLVAGTLAMIGTALLIWHMNIAWPQIVKTGQRLRYITLMWFSMTAAYAAIHDIKIDRLVEVSAVLSTIGCVLLIVTMVVSIRETLQARAKE